VAITTGARTLYELAIENGEQRLLLAYSSNRCRADELDIARKPAERLVALTETENIAFAKRAGDGATMGRLAHPVDRAQAARGGRQQAALDWRPTMLMFFGIILLAVLLTIILERWPG
jgi:hypothetical protein